MNKKRKLEEGSYNAVGILLVIVFSSVCHLVFGLLISAYVMQLDIWDSSSFLSVLGSYISLNIPHIVLFLSIIFGTHFILHTSFSRFTSEKKFRFNLFFIAFSISVAVMLLFSILFSKDSFFYSGVWKERVIMLPIILLITSVQCIAEELFFRVLPARLALGGKSLKSNLTTTLILSLFSGAIFLFPHLGGSEFTSTSSPFFLGFYYVSYGALAMFIALYTHGFEISFAIHMAINLYSSIVAGYRASALQAYPLFIKEGIPSILSANIQLYLIFILTFFAVTYFKRVHLEKEEKTNG